MHISATLPLILGTIAGVLFVGVFIAAWIITFRNRRIIRCHATAKPDEKDTSHDAD